MSFKTKLIGSCNHIQHFDLREHKGRSFVSTDLHGHYHLLHDKLKEVAFDSSKDLLFLAGDHTDRHADSKYVLDYLCEPWVFAIRGNHCEMLINAYENPNSRNAFEMLYCNGGQWYYDITPSEQKAIYEVFKSLPLAFEIQTNHGTIGIVHAQVPFDDWNQFKSCTKAEMEWNVQAISQWARTKYDKKDTSVVKGIDVAISGHTPTDSGELEQLGNQLFCDLGSFFREKISFVEIDSQLIRDIKENKYG